MMQNVLIDLMLEAIVEQYRSEKKFYEGVLKIDATAWEKFKTGQEALTEEQTQKIKGLFSDYEWMLVQKILRQTLIFPERRNFAVAEYRRLKTMIAKKWLDNGGEAELISKTTNRKTPENAPSFIDLKVSLNYGEWGFDDILMFRLPALIQQQLQGTKVDLLEWVNENLTDTYVYPATE